MKKIIIFLVLLILTSGCLERKEISYVCPDNSVVSNPESCPELETPAPERISITKYVCPNGEVVDDSEECEVKGEEELGTTSTLPATTTLEETTSTIFPTTTSMMLGTTTTTSLITTTTSTILTTTTTSSTVITIKNIEISATQFDAPGSDKENLNGEWVEIVNRGNKNVEMDGWTLEDEGGHTYSFPVDFILTKGNSVKVHTGKGQDTSSNLYWGSGRAIWNNDGDIATLKNMEGKVIDQEG